MMKKAQGLSMNVIIIAAIALLVLVILSVIFMGRMGIFSAGVKDCEKQGGRCSATGCPPAGDQYSAYTQSFSDGKCTPDTNTCCIVG